MNEETKRLEREIEREKTALTKNLTELEAKARAITDWRAQVRKRPFETVAVAVASGIALAMLDGPRRPGARRQAEADGDDNAVSSLMSHPIVARFVATFAAVAAERAVEALGDMMPGSSQKVAGTPSEA